MNNKFSITIIIIAAFLTAGLIQCKRSGRVVQPLSLTVSKAWWPAWDSFQLGVMKREQNTKSFQTKFLQKEDYVPALNEFTKGSADAATLTIYEALLAASEGIPLKIVLLLDYTIGSDGLVAGKSIGSLRDLKGKRIGVEKGTIAHFTVIKALEKAGLDHKEVKLVNLDLSGLQQAFLNEEIDAAGTYEPYMSELAKKGNGHVIFSSREIPRAICDVLFVKDSIVRNYPEAIDHWIGAWDYALNFKVSENKKYLQELSLLNKTPVEDLTESFNGIFFTNMAENRMAFGTPDKPGYLLESLRNMESFMLKAGVIPKKVDLNKMIEFNGVSRFFQE